jgi:hypothetical protein
MRNGSIKLEGPEHLHPKQAAESIDDTMSSEYTAFDDDEMEELICATVRKKKK